MLNQPVIDASKPHADALVKAIANLGYTAQKTTLKG